MAKEHGKRASKKAGVTLLHISPKLLIKTVTLISGYEEIHAHKNKHTDLHIQACSEAHTQIKSTHIYHMHTFCAHKRKIDYMEELTET